jgi:radical SAM superfamily enzyme YgiQ (UPF0313 family)
MSNNAIRILYSGLNSQPGVKAERVFAPAPDFESLLSRRGIPLYTLETGMALSDIDLLGFSLGYELAATSLLTVLGSGHIPLSASERGNEDPIVIAGGPAIGNPHPFAKFLDAAFVGEAEGKFFALAEELALLKKNGACRAELLERMGNDESVWIPSRSGSKGKSSVRAVFGGFGTSAHYTSFPLPTAKIVQDHGTVEIMRGCPNGCRFCQAGFYYRPQRLKRFDVIRSEVRSLVENEGCREITLSSLSSGDYPGVGELLDRLNAEWGGRRISFQLPSLKINSFNLPLVRKLSEVRKAGLTFAIETPIDAWQLCINKDVAFEKTLAILEEVRAAGFKQIKFYFMIGLPVPGRGEGEAKAILEFFDSLRARLDLQINVNVGTFVPKPHTPFQWSAQLREAEAMSVIDILRQGLRRHRNIKLSYHSPFLSLVEGIIARGDDRVGDLILSAYRKGARLDAWDEHFDRELWRSVFMEAVWPVEEECCTVKNRYDALPWDDISIRVSKTVLWREFEKSLKTETTSGCIEECNHPCGSCDEAAGVESRLPDFPIILPAPERSRKPIARLMMRYSKSGAAAYLPHLTVVDAFERAILILDLPVVYSEGFNPMPRLEISQPLPIAIESRFEIASIMLCEPIDALTCMNLFNSTLPVGIRVEDSRFFSIHEGRKHQSIGSLEWGSEYSIEIPDSLNHDNFLQRLNGEITIRNIPNATVFDLSLSQIAIKLGLPKRKEHGLMRILESCSDNRPIQAFFRISRTLQLARSEDGSPIDFFDAIAQSS